jgi:uncharacterized membrane protein
MIPQIHHVPAVEMKVAFILVIQTFWILNGFQLEATQAMKGVCFCIANVFFLAFSTDRISSSQ